MAEKKKYNSILISGRKDQTLTYSKYVKDEESGESVKESLDKKVNVTDKLETQQIKDGAITNEKLAENSITKDKLKDNTIGVEKLDTELRQTINAATGLPENLVETIQNVDDTLKDHQSQLNDKQSQIDDKQQQITANDEDISLLQTRSTQMEETINSIAATGGASQATAVTYNNEKSKLTSINIQSAVDEVVEKTAIKNEEGVVIETPFHYIQNEEFIFAKVDAENKLLFGIQWDGTPKFGKTSAVEDRLQSQVNLLADKITTILGDDDTTSAIDTLKELKDFFASIDNTQTLTSILANLNSISTKIGEDIKNLQDTKVDKEEGKSLIEDEVKECFRIIENEEFLKAIVDSDDKVLFGFYRVTGKPYYPLNEMYHVEQNEEFFALWLDAADHVLLGIRRDGQIIGEIHAVNALKKVISQLQSDVAALQEKVDTIDTNLKELLDVFSFQDNDEYLAVKQDAEGKVLAGRTHDGAAFENVSFTTPKVSIDGHIIENTEDIEGRSEITTDVDGRILSFRDKDGIKHEKVGIETPLVKTDNISLTEKGMTDFQKTLKESGFIAVGYSDFSEKKVVELPEPKHYAILNLIVDNIPSWWGAVVKGFAEYYDFAGNYFKKSISLETQGQTSVAFAIDNGKGNYTLDLTDDSEIKFGSWVPQDSFHLKGCAKDVTRCILPTSYKFAYKFMEYLDAKPNRVLLKDNKITTTNATGDRTTDWTDEARCLPDGFPVEIYVNGEYWGLYSWQLKKNRKNYSMNKSDYTSFFLDADSMMSTDRVHGFWNDGPDALVPESEDRNWWMEFEIKNPKNLICMNGEPYDYDKGLEYREPIDETSEFYDPSNNKHKGSKQTKDIIRAFSTKYLEVKSLIDAENIVQAKEKFNEYFDYNACMLVYIFNCLMGNSDSIGKNTLWGTYKNGKIAPFLWDLDAMYGLGWIGTSAGSPGNYMWTFYGSFAWPLMLLYRLYYNEIKTTYAELRDNNIISINTWKEIMYGWINRVGHEAYERDIEKWSETPSYRKNYTNTEYWVESSGATEEWNENTIYQQGDKVYLPMSLREQLSGNRQSYEAVQASQGICPVTEFYNLFPRVGGYYDSPKRMEKWMIEQIRLCDIAMNYNN